MCVRTHVHGHSRAYACPYMLCKYIHITYVTSHGYHVSRHGIWVTTMNRYLESSTHEWAHVCYVCATHSMRAYMYMGIAGHMSIYISTCMQYIMCYITTCISCLHTWYLDTHSWHAMWVLIHILIWCIIWTYGYVHHVTCMASPYPPIWPFNAICHMLHRSSER